jgi:dienelactone hydrolase
MLGAYGSWAAEQQGEEPGTLSFRNPRWSSLDEWKTAARAALRELLRLPKGTGVADVQVHRSFSHDGLDVEELSWQLAYGPRTQAYFLKPHGASGRLPGILALHDHAGNKYFGKRKIVRVDSQPHPMMERHRKTSYGGAAWANEIARRGFAVLVHDTFPFESRRILASDLPAHVVGRLMSPPQDVRELTPEDLAQTRADTSLDVPPHEPEDLINTYNAFASQHESIIAKSLFCAGLTWPGVTVSEDRAALDYLASRPDVDAGRLACGGLSGGGLRTVLLAGLDDRIRAAVCAGFMTTWRDFLLNTSYTHTWMIYVPGLAALLDFPEILALRAPLPAMVLATTEDPLFTGEERERATRILEETYRKVAAPEKLAVSIHPGPHKFDLPMQAAAFRWIETMLR